MDIYGDPLLTILQGGVTIAATVALPELIPFIGPLFQIAKGTLGLVSAIKNRDEPNEIDLLKGLEKSIEGISREIIGKGKLGRPDEYCTIILRELEKYPNDCTKIDFKALADNLGSLHLCMVGKVQKYQCDTSESWIHCLCDVYQNESRSNDDATWGFKDAFRQFTQKYVLQMQALIVLRTKDSVDHFIENIQKQVDMFWKEFEERWKSDCGEMKLAKEFPSPEMGTSVSYGDISYNKENQHSYFYRFVDTNFKGKSEVQVIDLTDGYKQVFSDSFTCKITNSRKESKILVNEGKLFTVDCDSKVLLVFDLKVIKGDPAEILCGTKFRKRTQMVCHKKFLYAVSTDGKVCKINPAEENCEDVISEGWCDPTALAVTDGESPIYAISKGIKSQGRSNSFYMIKPAQEKRRKQGYTEIHPESPITNMAITGHGSHVYAVEESTLISAYDTKDGMSRSLLASELDEKIGGKQTSVHLMSDGLTLYLQVNSAEGMKLYLIKPHFVTPVESPSHISKLQAVCSGPKGTVVEGEVPKKEEPEEEESEAMEETDFSKARRALASADSAGKTKKKSAKQRKVDGHCGLPSAKVVADWDCMLNQTNIGHNNNKYYVIQLLQAATLGVMSSSSFVVFTRWGRVGEPGRQDTMHEPFATVEKAEKEFKKKFSDKTKNKWDDRHAFVPAPGKYTLLEMDEDDDGDDEILLKSDTSKLQAVCSGPKEVKYMGINAPTMEHLVTALKNKAGKKFNLADKICNCWKDIGLKLGIEPAVLDSIESNKRKDSERLCEVFDRWLNNAAGLPNSKSYPLSWQGLETLLKDCDKSEVVKQYFEFIGKMEY